MWQDILFTGGQLILGAVLIPTLLDEEAAVPRWTSVPTSLVLFAFAAGYATMGLLFSALSTAAAAALWAAVVAKRSP